VFRTDLGQKIDINSEYEHGAKLDKDGHVYLSDGSHSAKCEEWDGRAKQAGLEVKAMWGGNIQKFLATNKESPFRKDAYNWPSVIAFDYNGTLDLRGTGKNVGIDALLALKQSGKTVVIFTSSVDADGKEFMRTQLAKLGIIYTDDEDILDQADIFVGDKRSDERRAGKHGCKFINVNDFDLGKLLSKSLNKAGAVSMRPGGAQGHTEEDEQIGAVSLGSGAAGLSEETTTAGLGSSSRPMSNDIMGEEDDELVDTGTDARLKILPPSEEVTSPGTDLRLAPKNRHYAR
jgi:hypothetical protein